MERLNRRKLISSAGIFALGGAAAYAAGITTPPEPEGPFYPVPVPSEKDADLTRVAGSQVLATGQIIEVRGVLTDVKEKPIAGAVIEIWQACHTGRYNHPRDPNPAAIDRNFQYFARMITREDGSYGFRSIIPGAYPADTDWIRPPHIHFRVDPWQGERLTTQMYFAGQELNEGDLILQKTANDFGTDAANSLVVGFSSLQSDVGPIKRGRFDIKLGTTPHAD